jgi:iron complex transport system permease protein
LTAPSSAPSSAKRAPIGLSRLGALHLGGAAALLVCVLLGLAVGPVAIDPLAALSAPADDPARVILLGARAPRVLLAAVVGGALGLAGAALQALLQNPLACPHVLGISGGAALLAIVAMIAVPAAPLGVVPTAAFVGAAGTAALVRGVARSGGRVTPHTLLLTGVVFNAFAAALITFLNTLVDFYRAHNILGWVVGNLTVRGGAWTAASLATLLLGLLVLSASARDLNALGLGEEGASSLCVDVARSRRLVYAEVALLNAGAVQVS